jgi:hypothetical protein
MIGGASNDVHLVLRPYGLAGAWADEPAVRDGIRAADRPDAFADLEADCEYVEEPRRYGRAPDGTPAFRPVGGHVTFVGRAVAPIWADDDGRAVLAWHEDAGRRTLLIGVDVAEQIVRLRQGDPDRVLTDDDRARYGFDWERPNYLFEPQLDADHPTIPWADRLGFAVAEAVSRLAGWPLIEPLPDGARGAIVLSGDDDQAYLEKYDDQLRLLGGAPITYFLVPETRHNEETLRRLPPGVEISVHPDALDEPGEYDRLCAEQTAFVRRLSGAAVRTVRNHGYLSEGYLGHLDAWEANGIVLDVNLPGVDGTALNGSFLPAPTRRPDGTWSPTYNLLTAFGDGMQQALEMTPRAAARRVRSLVRQVEHDNPGALVFNLHPQNVGETKRLHRAALRATRRRGWTALGVESYLDWILARDDVDVVRAGDGFLLRAETAIEGLVVRTAHGNGWIGRSVPRFEGERVVPT